MSIVLNRVILATLLFVDGGFMIAPRGGFFSREGKWAVENVGTPPDIDVENSPKDVIAGHDPQLERAVQEAMRILREKPVTRLTTEPPPPGASSSNRSREVHCGSG
jgi:tricorn protease